jgi:hypothetical protein
VDDSEWPAVIVVWAEESFLATVLTSAPGNTSSAGEFAVSGTWPAAARDAP